MITVSTVDEVRGWSRQQRAEGRRVALVPTMGFLHEGHLTLVREARRRADAVAVSIFVNPTQFGPDEDLDRYPRALERDAALLRGEGVEALFVPTVAEMYPQGFQTTVRVAELSLPLCGGSRPGHFDGVATVVAKLLLIVEPDLALFGEKDFQQLQVIRRMVADLNLPVAIQGVATVREADGLAMSSRNDYLNPEQRQQALCLSQSLHRAQQLVAAGGAGPEEVRAAVAETVAAAGGRLDYAELLDPDTLQPVSDLLQPALLALAVFIGPARLIDNCVLRPS